MKNNFQSKAVPRGTRTIWRYLGALILLFSLSIGQMWGDNCTTLVSFATSQHQTSSPRKVYGYTTTDMTEASRVELTCDDSNTKGQNSGVEIRLNYGNKYLQIPSQTSVTSVSLDYKFYNSGTTQRTCSLKVAVGSTEKIVEISGKNSDGYKNVEVTFSPAATGAIKITNMGSGNSNLNLYLDNISYCTSSATDVTAPTLSSSVPANSATDVAVEGTIVLTFSEAIATVDGTKFSLSGATKGTVAIDGTDSKKVNVPYSGAANSTTVTLSVAAEAVADAAGNKSAALDDIAFTTVAAETPACPSGLTISGTTAYTEGQTISLTAALEAGNGEITYTWYKGSIAAGNEMGTGASFSKASCATSDAGNYFCVASKDACSDAESTAYAVTVEEKTCPTSGVLYTMTMKSKSLSSVTQYEEVALAAGDYATETGGVSYLGNNNSTASKAQIKTEAGGIVYFDGNDAYLKVALDCPLQPGDLITIEGNASSTELKYLITNTNSRSSYVTSTNTTGTKKYYTVVADDILDEKSNVYFWREGSSGNKNIHSITITRPYEITFANGGHGTVPSATTGFEIALTQITGVEGWVHTGWTANKVVKVGGSDVAIGTAMAVDATAAVSANTTFTAVWEEEAATYSVTYKANNGTAEEDVVHPAESAFAANMFTAPDGKKFNGWNTKAEGDGTLYAVGAAVPAETTVYAQWVVDPTIRLIKNDGTLNTVNFITGATLKDDGPFTVDAVSYAKNVQFGNSCSGVSSIDNLNKAIIYHSATNATKVTIVAYDNYTGGSTANLYYAVVPEGTTSASATTKTMNKSTGDVYEVNMTGRSTIYIYCGHKEVRICQVLVEETGTANAVAPEVGYSVNLNKQRPFFASGEVTAFEGIEYKVSSNFKPLNGQVQIGTLTDTYYKFTIPTGQTRQLQLTTSNTSKYIVSQTLGDDTEEKKVSGNQTINLTAGIWYINPQGSNVNITNIAFAATPDPITVAFMDGSTKLGEQALFVGDKVTEPSPAPTKSGYRLVGWQKSGADYDFDTELVAGDAPGFTLDAVWQKTWTVTFDSDGGSDVDPVTVDDGAKVTAPDPAPTKPGNDFAGWYGKGESDAFDFNNTIDQDTTIVAHWTPLDNDASISALTYDGKDIDISSGVDFAYVLPYKASYVAGKLEVTTSATSATVGEITYAAGVASFTVTAGDGVTTQDYTVTFTNGPKDMLTLIGTKVTGNNDHGPVYGYYAGSAAVKVASGSDYTYKLNKGNYIGVTLIDGQQFQAGDVAKIRVTDKQGATGFTLYTTNTEDSVLIMDTRTTTVIENGIHELVLPSYAGSQSLYLLRQNNNTTSDMNPCVDSIAVYRPYPVPVVNTITFNGAAGVVGESTITATIPYTTDIASLPIVATFLSNDPSLTTGAVGGPWVENEDVYTNTYVVTDKDEDTKTYTVTLTRAAVSHDASLTALEVEGYSLTPAFDPAILSYSVELPYGSAIGDLPTVTYTPAAAATAVKVDATELPGNTVITVTAEDESTEQEYKIRFTVNRTPTLSVFDGRTMNAAVVTFTDPTSGLTWTSEDAATSSSGNTKTINGKTYTKSVKIFGSATNASRYLKFTVPADYVAKFYLAGSTNSSTGEATLFFSKELTADPAKAIAGLTASVDDPKWAQTDYQLPGDYYFCVTGSARIYELSVTLYPIDEERAMTQGRFGTICYPNGGYLVGAMLLEIAYFDPDQKKIFFDEVIGGKMIAGAPYLFLPNEGVDKFAITYTDNLNAAAGHHNGLYGSYTQEALSTDGNHYIMLNNQYCKVVEANTYVGANRAYILLDKIGDDYVAPAYGRRRVSMSVNTKDEAQGFENLQSGDAPMKVMIDGTLYIIRGEKVFDATGRLVK